ncbi:hypothetical protein BDP55DRAFT_239144 [Colletotrichum godetiae]|uniref:Uncharacterized protein n=1 Tax=Colletotrichum godetiae TaxID=1209918 RepID=A0AAJ0AF73_9PEZI|nr:uncharacterized protein BDP55DRAFT_239144 [Colletotrichum godetiae]KAK1672792.1 hypothetical protein BDP55DRAFT_239144 [Colletotrichum godetiae]
MGPKEDREILCCRHFSLSNCIEIAQNWVEDRDCRRGWELFFSGPRWVLGVGTPGRENCDNPHQKQAGANRIASSSTAWQQGLWERAQLESAGPTSSQFVLFQEASVGCGSSAAPASNQGNPFNTAFDRKVGNWAVPWGPWCWCFSLAPVPIVAASSQSARSTQAQLWRSPCLSFLPVRDRCNGFALERGSRAWQGLLGCCEFVRRANK